MSIYIFSFLSVVSIYQSMWILFYFIVFLKPPDFDYFLAEFSQQQRLSLQTASFPGQQPMAISSPFGKVAL